LLLKIEPQQTEDINVLEVAMSAICRKTSHKQSKIKREKIQKKLKITS